MDIDMDKMPEYSVTDENKTAIYEEQRVNYGEKYKEKTGIADLIIDEREDGKKVAKIKTLTPETAKLVKDSKGKVNSISIKNFDKGYNGSELSEVVYTPKELNECAVKLEELISDLKNNNEFTVEEKVLIVAGRISQVVATDWESEQQLQEKSGNFDSRFVRASSTIGALIDGKANSQGYADLFKNAMDSLGIPCRMISGKIKDYESSSFSTSYWNQVEFEKNKWGSINVFNLDMQENNIIDFLPDMEKAKTGKDMEKVLKRMTKADSKEFVPDRYITMLAQFNSYKYTPNFFDERGSAREEGIEMIYDGTPKNRSEVLSAAEGLLQTATRLARYENEEKAGIGKTLKRLKLSKNKYLVMPLNEDLTPEEAEQWKGYNESQNEKIQKIMPLYYKQKDANRIFLPKANEFRDSLKVSENQLLKNEGNTKDDNIKQKDEELDR